MVTTTLHYRNSAPRISKRPAILKHKSQLLRVFSTIYKAIWLLPGLDIESQVICVKLFEGLYENSSNPTTYATITLSDPSLQLYDTRLVLQKRLQGVQYLMVHKWFTTGLLGVFFAMLGEVGIGLLVWWWKRVANPKSTLTTTQPKPKEKEVDADSSVEDTLVEPSSCTILKKESDDFSSHQTRRDILEYLSLPSARTTAATTTTTESSEDGMDLVIPSIAGGEKD